MTPPRSGGRVGERRKKEEQRILLRKAKSRQHWLAVTGRWRWESRRSGCGR